MYYETFGLLNGEEVDRIVQELGRHTFVDGKLTAGGQARQVKHNLQIDRDGTELGSIDGLIVSGFARHQAFLNFAMPSRYLMPMFSRYEPGMAYGDHIDNSLMGGFSGLRTDLAVTIFLSHPDGYDGGELVIEGQGEIKLDCGEAVVYPATSIHHVAPVTRGVRLAAITWLQSAVRDERLRAILYDLSRAAEQTEAAKNHPLTLLINKSYHNLVRYASEP